MTRKLAVLCALSLAVSAWCGVAAPRRSCCAKSGPDCCAPAPTPERIAVPSVVPAAPTVAVSAISTPTEEKLFAPAVSAAPLLFARAASGLSPPVLPS